MIKQLDKFIQTLTRRRKAKEVECPSCHRTRLVTIENLKRMSSMLCQDCALRSGVKPKTGRYQTCKRCGKEYWVVPARFNRSAYCSKECQNYIQSRNCAHCGKLFKPTQDSAKFCSYECSHASTISRVTKICETCGNEFQVTKARESAKFCSKQCQMNRPVSERPNYRNGKYSGNSHPYPYGSKWSSIRKWILERDSRKCQHPKCHSSLFLQVHHKNRFDDKFDKDSQNNPDNLITLCRKHHQEIHRHK